MERFKGWLPAIRVLASAVMLVILVKRVHVTSILPSGGHGFRWLAAAVAVWTVGVILSAVRWQRVLVALDIKVGLRVLVTHYLASLFVSNFLPSTVGGDVLR
nr:flippase-like domain-containing protein [Actinomycetota bacterium]